MSGQQQHQAQAPHAPSSGGGGHASHAAHLPFHKHVLAGAGAGLVEVLIMYPLDVVKTRWQLQVGSGTRQTVLGAFRDVVRQEGLLNLYRGIIAPILAEAPKRALKFSSNEQYKKLLLSTNRPGEKLTQLQSVIAGAGAGMTEAVINCPFELVKVRMQARENLGLYSNTWDATTKIVSKEGVLALYNGLEAQLWRNGTWNAAYFGTINWAKNNIPTPGWAGDSYKNFQAGLIAGTLATTLNNPFDVVKSRVQNVLPGQTRRYNWTLPGIVKVWREEGFKALYKGYVPKVLRLGPGGGIMLVGFEFFAKLLS